LALHRLLCKRGPFGGRQVFAIYLLQRVDLKVKTGSVEDVPSLIFLSVSPVRPTHVSNTFTSVPQVVDNLEGAKKALTEDGTLVFMWEKFTTAPLVKSGLFRCVGECPTPWPCFSIAAKRSLLQRMAPDGRSTLLSTVLETVRETCERFKANSEESVSMWSGRVTNKYQSLCYKESWILYSNLGGLERVRKPLESETYVHAK
jgi:hypothetical protein